MKITSFNPLIVTTDPESVIKLFEELGFEKITSIINYFMRLHCSFCGR